VRRERFDVAMVDVSDHGESLAEHALYLHGVPWAIAPREQREAPKFRWIPPEDAARMNVDLACLRQRAAEPSSPRATTLSSTRSWACCRSAARAARPGETCSPAAGAPAEAAPRLCGLRRRAAWRAAGCRPRCAG
jgi:hypothetical protein